MQISIPVEKITATLPDNAPLTDAARLIEALQTEAEAIATKHLSSLGPVPVEICLTNTPTHDDLGFYIDSANGLDMQIPLATMDMILTELKAALEKKASRSSQIQ